MPAGPKVTEKDELYLSRFCSIPLLVLLSGVLVWSGLLSTPPKS